MRTRAAVAMEAGKPLEVMEVNLEGPKAGEVMVEIKATGICHTDDFTRSGADPEGLFPAILGHEGAGVVVEVGPGVTSVKVGDHVIPLYTPECRQCASCLSGKTNLCTAIRNTQGQGLMPDGTSRFSMLDGTPIHHYMGCSTFSNYTVLPEIAVAKVREDAPFDKICYIGCGVTTGIGAVINTAKVEIGAKAVVFGLGGIGLNVLQGLRLAGADMIIGVDLNDDKKPMAEYFGMTHFINPKTTDNVVQEIINLTENLDCYEVYPHIEDYDDLGRYYIEELEVMQVPEHLRNYAGLRREIVVIGALDHIEVWDAEAWASYAAAQEEAFAQMDEEVFGAG